MQTSDKIQRVLHRQIRLQLNRLVTDNVNDLPLPYPDNLDQCSQQIRNYPYTNEYQ